MTGPIPVLTEIRLSSIIESSDDAILTKDAEGTITSWNPAAERMYGWTADEAIGQKISILIPEDRSGEEWRILEQVMGGEQVDHYESDRVHRSGRRIRVSLSISPLNDETGAIVGASIIARDITSQHRSRDFATRLHKLTAAFASEITRQGAVRRFSTSRWRVSARTRGPSGCSTTPAIRSSSPGASGTRLPESRTGRPFRSTRTFR